MKIIIDYKLLFVLSLFLISLGSNALLAQEKNDSEGSNIPSLLVFDNSKEYALQNSSRLLENEFKFSPEITFSSVSLERDNLGLTHQKFQQYYDGLKVEFATCTLHEKEGRVSSMSNNIFDIRELDVTPAVSVVQAFNRAIGHVGAAKYLWEDTSEALLFDNYQKPTGELVVFPPVANVSETATLAYKFDIYALDPVYRADVYIDAQTGQFIMENKKIHHANVPATGTSLYNGNVAFTADNASGPYRLRQTADGNGVQTFDLNNGTSYNNASDVTSNSTNFTGNATGVQAHFGAEQTHKYFQGNHGRNSYNNAGAIIKSYVSYSSNYVNAFWDGQRMTYGDGDGVNYGPLVSVDIVGHEIAHGVTEYSANLVYSYQSGALNESFSDIFGESIEKYASGSNDWLMGDQIGAGGSGGALRSMSNPNVYGDPDTYLGTNWYSGSGDNGGVHYNSGVQNKWFYILTVGESGTNDNGSSYNVSGIGMDKAGAIAYRNLSVYLGSNSQYSDARAGAIQSAIDLYGAGSAEEIATTNAWYAVGVGAAYGTPSNYCNSASTNVNDEYISRVQLGTINNSSGAQFYSDFTNQSTDLNEGQAYTITVTPTWTGRVYSEGYAVWIDYNNDQDFSDAGELVWSKSTSTNTPNSGTFTVPAGTAGTATRMRVSMKYNGVPTACETFTYGEVEDYTVNLGGSGADTQSPSNPTSLATTNITQTTVDLSWNASTDNVGVTGYDVYQGTSNIGTVTGTSVQITGLTASTSYTFSVRARDAAGNISGASNTVNVTTSASPDTQAPSNPSNLVASNIAETTADLSWSASTDNVAVTGYDVYQGAANIGTVTGTSVQITGLTASTSYTFSVRARDAAGNVSGASNTVNVTTSAPPADTQAPSVPIGLVVTSVTQNTVDFSWNASSDNVGVTGYDVYQGTTSLGTVSGTTYQASGLTASTSYTFSVRARDAAGNVSGASNALAVTTSGSGGGPTVLHEGYFESGWDGWTDGGSDAYRYSGSRSSEGSYSIRLRDNTNSSKMTLGSFDVTSYNSIEIEFYFYARSMENNEDFWVQFYNGSSWQTVATYARGSDFNNNTFYTATVSIDSGSYNFPSNAQFRFRNDASANNDQVYIDAVTITANSGTTFAPTINSISALSNGSQGLLGDGDDEFDFDGDFLLYPNPVQTILNVKMLDASDAFTYRIFNMLGQTLRNGDLSSTSIDVQNLQSGVYFIEINNGEEFSTQRFIKK
ncbi:M4 family metallopeptidase [Ulvibacter sp.]|nr:M4 family metallopeptidase [Ulvibacter sp.]